MKNIANCISISRIVMSIILAIPKTFSIPFCIIYIYCGISDMLDGFIARRTKSTSKVGTILDSIADIVFVIIAMIKILPVLNLSNAIIIWASIIALIKIMNIIFSYICYKKVVLPHTFANRITGLVLFVTPLIIVNFDSIIFEIVVCVVATFSAIQEGYYIKTKKVIF